MIKTFHSFADTTTVTDTTIHTATGLRITPPTTPEHTTDPRITVAPMTNTRDLPTRGARITTPDLSRKVETGETTITEVALGIIRLKVGTIRTAIGTAIQRLVMQIRRVRPSPALYTIAKDMEKRNEALRLTGRKDDSFWFQIILLNFRVDFLAHSWYKASKFKPSTRSRYFSVKLIIYFLK